jgi:Fe-S cluster assembly protein SufD
MNVVAEQSNHFLDEYHRLHAQRPGADALAEVRQAAIARFAELGVPNQRQEAWKYTNVAPIMRRAFGVASSGRTEPAIDIAALSVPGLDAFEYVFVNGHFREDLSRIAGLPAGARVASIADCVNRQPEWALAQMARHAAGDAFVALNTAFVDDGAAILVDDGVVLDKPIHLLFITAGAVAPTAIFPQVWIRAGRGARVRVIETFKSVANAIGFTNILTDIVAAEQASVEHVKIQDENAKSYHIGNLFIEQARDSEVVSHSLSFGAQLARQDIRVTLDAENAATILNGFYMAEGRQHVDHHTRVDHVAPHTRSEESYKGVLGGAARGVFNGKVVVHPRAFKTDARQSNNCLLLSKDAEADSKPELEIYADDVKCAHGATVGQLDANALFYLRSRGIDADAARRLLTFAFAAEVLNRVPDAPIREALTARVAGRLPDTIVPEDLT